MEYNIRKDLILVRSFLGISSETLASELNENVLVIARTEAGISTPNIDFIEKFYSFCYSKGIDLNIQKEMLYREEIPCNHILLTHGSKNGIVGSIDIHHGKERNDFGPGFYCGSSYEKSVSFISNFTDSSVYFIDFDPAGLTYQQFQVNLEWMLAIAFFRKRLGAFSQHPTIQKVIQSISDTDYIIAPIADNRMFAILDSFLEGDITDVQCEHCLAATNLGSQYVFLSEKSIPNLTLLEKCYVSRKEKEYYISEQKKLSVVGNNKVKLARIQYKGQGKYIEELFQ